MTTYNIRLTVETDDTAANIASIVADALIEVDVEVIEMPVVTEKGARGRKELPSTAQARELILAMNPGQRFTTKGLKVLVPDIQGPTLWALLNKLINSRHIDKLVDPRGNGVGFARSGKPTLATDGVELDFTNVDKYKEN